MESAEEKLIFEWSGPEPYETAESWIKHGEFFCIAQHFWTDNTWVNKWMSDDEDDVKGIDFDDDVDKLSELMRGRCEASEEAKDELQEELGSRMAEDYDWGQCEWEYANNLLTELVRDRFSENGWIIEGSNLGWRNQSGSMKWTPDKDDNLGEKLYHDIFPKTDLSLRFNGTREENGSAVGQDFFIGVAHHDSPAWGYNSEGYTFTARTEIDVLVEDANEGGGICGRAEWDEDDTLYLDDEEIGQVLSDTKRWWEEGCGFICRTAPIADDEDISKMKGVIRRDGTWYRVFGTVEDLIEHHFQQREEHHVEACSA